jgi:RNA polymerase sigma factor (sigma-70 family)
MDQQQASDIRERLSRLWMQAEPSVNAYVFATVQRFHDAEDVVQQVALTAARRFEEYDGSRPFVAWVLWLAKSKIIDYYRVQGRQKLVFSETLLDQTAARLVERQEADHAGAAALEKCVEKSALRDPRRRRPHRPRPRRAPPTQSGQLGRPGARVGEEFPLECPGCGGDIGIRGDGRQEPAHAK